MTIAAKDLHMAIKRGETATEFASKYAITVDELYSYIRTKMHAGSKNLIRELEKNEKLSSRSRKSKTSSYKKTEVAEVTEVAVKDDSTEKKENELKTREEQLLQLKSDEEELSSELCLLEREHEAMAEKRRSILHQAKECNEKLVKLQEVLLAEESKVEEFMAEYEKLAENMSSNTAERRTYEELLAEVRQTIENLSKVEIHINQDCTIECSKPEVFDCITTEGEEAELITLMGIPEAENYTLKQLRAIARIRVIKKYININVVCDFSTNLI